jgi:hypothetical protein
MKNLILILPALLMLGCSVQQDCCETDNHQCDEFYPYYNCPDPTVGYYYRDYKRTWSTTSSWSSYYPNTQTVYYVPVQEPVTQPVNNGNRVLNTPRPERLGEYRERPSKPVNNNTRSTRD